MERVETFGRVANTLWIAEVLGDLQIWNIASALRLAIRKCSASVRLTAMLIWLTHLPLRAFRKQYRWSSSKIWLGQTTALVGILIGCSSWISLLVSLLCKVLALLFLLCLPVNLCRRKVFKPSSTASLSHIYSNYLWLYPLLRLPWKKAMSSRALLVRNHTFCATLHSDAITLPLYWPKQSDP